MSGPRRSRPELAALRQPRTSPLQGAGMRQEWTASRRLAVAGLALGALTLAIVLFARPHGYVIHARFADAGGLVGGSPVEVAGNKVGSVGHIGLTPHGLADVELDINDGAPLHEGTRAAIRAVGQAGVANRFVELSPGPADAPPLPSGAVLGTAQTSGIVNLDALLDAFGPRQRADVQELIDASAHAFAGSTARDFNQMLGRFDPALAELGATMRELDSERGAIAHVIRDASTDATALASRSADLRAGVSASARWLAALAGERGRLADLLRRAPVLLVRARGTLADAGRALTALRPTLRAVPDAAAPLHEFLALLSPALEASTPVVARLRAELPGLDRSLSGLAPLRTAASLGLRSAGHALRRARHIVRVARIYGSDLLLGVLNGLAGVSAANHDRWGHYARLEFTQPPQTTLGGPLGDLLTQHPLVPGIIDLRTRLLRRCPGGNAPPAMDNSSPWVPDPSICDPSQDVPLSVDMP